MNSIELKSRLHQYIDRADQQFLKIVDAMFEQYFNNDEGNTEEDILIKKVKKTITQKQAQRLEELKTKRAKNDITNEELEELFRLVDLVEKLNVERVLNLTKLAQLKKTSVRILMEDLNIQPRKNA